LKLDIDIAPRLLAGIPQPDEFIVDYYQCNDDNDKYR